MEISNADRELKITNFTEHHQWDLCLFEQQSQRMGDQAEVMLLKLREPKGHQHNVLGKEKNSFTATFLWEMRLTLLTCGQHPFPAK